MGKEIEKVAIEKGVKVISIIDPLNEKATHREINKNSLKGVDVAIDFTLPKFALENARKISNLGVNIVLGTTGWYERKAELEEIIKENGTGLIWSGNFSIGVNVFFKIIESASKIINSIEEYDIAISDVHHNQKLDSPSGTALMIGNIVLENIKRKKEIIHGSPEGRIKEDQLQISSQSIGFVPGIHTVTIDSFADTIKLEHSARNRTGFASGAVMAAEFIKGKKGFFNIDSLMDEIVGGD